MTGQRTRRRALLAVGLTTGLVGVAGCVRRQRPEASHWAAGIRWSESTGEVFRELGFSPRANRGSYSANPKTYFRVNGGALQRSALKDDTVTADRGDRVEIVVDFDTWRQGKETVFEYTIPDDPDLVGVLAGFAECLHYRGTDEWRVRPLNVDLGTDLLGRQRETLVVRVEREHRDENPDWFVWGHTGAIREALRDRAVEYYSYDAEVEFEFLDAGEEATFAPAAFRRVGMAIYDGGEGVAGVSYPEPDAEP